MNEDPTEKLIMDLKSENEKLKKMLQSGQIDPSMMSGGASDGESSFFVFFLMFCFDYLLSVL